MTDATNIPEGDWQHLWFLLQGTPWSALAIVPADSGIDVSAIADAFVQTGQKSGVAQLTLLNGIGVRANEVQDIVDAIETAKQRGGQVVVACDHAEDNPGALPIARAASGVLLVVRLGQSRLAAARKTVDAVGRERVIASITLKPA